MDNDRASLPDSRRVDLVAKLHQGRDKAGDSLVRPGGEVKLVDLPWRIHALDQTNIIFYMPSF